MSVTRKGARCTKTIINGGKKMSYIETKSFSEIYEDYKQGVYTFKLSEPRLTKVSENHVFDEDLSVKKNREMAIQHNEAVVTQARKIMSGNNDMHQKLKNDLIDCMLSESRVMTREIAEKIFEQAYAEKHSCMSDFFYYIEELFDFVDECIIMAKKG